MALSLNSTATWSCLQRSQTTAPQPSLSCSTRDYVGLKLQSSNSLGLAKPNLNVQFHYAVQKSLVSGTNKATKARVTMMPIGTPRVPYKSPGEGSWQWVDLPNALYRERILFMGHYMDEEFCNQLLATMLYLDTVDTSEKLYMYFICPGGDLIPSMTLYDTMQSLKTPVATHCVGFAYNLAAFLLVAGEKGFRTSIASGRIEIRPLVGKAQGQADDIRNEANQLSRARDYLFKEFAEKTGQPLDKVYKDLSRVKRFDGQQMLEYGIIDRILRPSKVQPEAPKKYS